MYLVAAESPIELLIIKPNVVTTETKIFKNNPINIPTIISLDIFKNNSIELFGIGSKLVVKVTGKRTILNTNENNNLILILIKVSPIPGANIITLPTLQNIIKKV